nr:uncharacterized protein LOC108944345 [Nicotiana tomentosiformis]
MDDMSGFRKDNAAAHVENVETSDGRSTPAQNDLVLWLEQNILELQGELEQTQNCRKGYKPPKFEMFDRTCDPKVHLRTYYDKLVGVGKDERIRMKLFIRSLTGDALSWFNTENAPNIFYKQNLKKKPTETFCKYATRWISEAAKVRLALEEEQMNKFFVRTQVPQYYIRLMVIENHKFSDIIKLGERIEEGIKSGMVTNFEELQATNKALQSGGISKRKEVGAVMKPRPNFDRRPPRQYTPIADPIDQLYERLKAAGYVTHIPDVAMENSSQWVNPNKICAYYSGMKGHTIDECRILKDKIQTLIDTKVIQAKEVAPNVHNNPLPDHRGEGVNMIETDEEWDLEGSIGIIREGDNPKKPAVTLTPIMFEVETTPATAPDPFEIEVTTPFTVTVASTPPFKSNVVPWDYAAKSRRKGKAKMEESGATQGMTRTGRIYTPENLGGTSREAASKQPIIETGPDDLWRKVQAREYFVVEHLNKTPAQISVLSLL